MQLVVNCWAADGNKRSVRLPVMLGDAEMARDLRAAITTARSGSATGLVWSARPEGDPRRAIQGGATAVAVVAAVAALLFLTSAGAALAVWAVGLFVVGGFAWEWNRRSTVTEVFGDGRLVRRAPLRIVSVDLTGYRRVTIKIDRRSDDAGDAVPFN